MKKLGAVVCLLLLASACGGTSKTSETPTTTVSSSSGTLLTSPGLPNPPSYPSSLDIEEKLTGSEAFEELTSAERQEWIRTDLLLGLPWRDAEEMAHDAGWSTKVIFAVEGEPVMMTMDLSLTRLRLIVFGGEEVGTVVDVVNS